VKGITVVDRTETALEQLKTEMNDGRILTVAGDVADESTAEAYIKATVDKWGRVDIVVLNAGIEGKWHSVHEMPMEVYDQVMAVNARGVYVGLKHSLGAFMNSPSTGEGCSAILMSSAAGLEGLPLISPYTASKFAVRGMAAVASQEYGKYGIRVNAICPGCE
jgi:NAD(P)-dependent dehydrogenase (short-subunit alcohol dehydrogenase family)